MGIVELCLFFIMRLMLVGPPRSGTSLLIEILRKTGSFDKILKEPESIYRVENGSVWIDSWVNNRKNLKKSLASLGENFAEKTPANALRFEDIVECRMPIAFILLIRNPHDLLRSLLREHRGGLNHYSLDGNNIRGLPTYNRLLKQARFKVLSNRSKLQSPRYFYYSIVKGALFFARHLGFNNTPWGPKMIGYRSFWKYMSTEQYYLRTIEEMYRSMLNGLEALEPGQKFMVLSYSDLTKNPKQVLQEVLKFIDNKDVSESEIDALITNIVHRSPQDSNNNSLPASLSLMYEKLEEYALDSRPSL